MRRPRLISRLYADERAAVLLEFAIALPVLLILFFGVYEISRYLLFRERLESAAIQMLDLITQGTNVDATTLDNVYSTLPPIMLPYSAENPRIIVTQIVRPPGNCQPVSLWQFREGGSRIAPTVGSRVDLDQIVLEPGDNVMAIEVMADYRPVINNRYTQGFIGEFRQYVASFGHTRYGSFNIDPTTARVVTPGCVQ